MTTRRSGGKRARRGGVILVYHRAAEGIPDPHGLCVSPQHLSEHLEVLSDQFTPTSMDEMGRSLRGGTVPPSSVVITFDDGYADNLTSAKPRLESHGVPALFFVATDYVVGQREFWWDELERCLLGSPSLPSMLELTIGRKRYKWELGEEEPPERDDSSYWNWKIWSKGTPTSRHEAYRDLHALMRSMLSSERERVLEKIRTLAAFDSEPPRSAFRPLTVKEVSQLEDGDLFEVGSHTRTHPVLASLPLEAQVEEIQGSKGKLEEILGHTVEMFAYPFGGKSDYSSDTVRVAKKAGFAAACAGFPGRVTRSTDPFQLPRYLVFNWDGKAFERHLEKFFSRAWPRFASFG